MHTSLTHIVAESRAAEMRRGADHARLVRLAEASRRDERAPTHPIAIRSAYARLRCRFGPCEPDPVSERAGW
jgi:hypothetical protein